MKAISPILATMMIIMLSIIVVGAGAAVIFSITQDSSSETEQSTEDFIHDKTINLRIESATFNSLKVRNLGTSPVGFSELYVLDGYKEVDIVGEGAVNPSSTQILNFSRALDEGSYKLVTPIIDIPFKIKGSLPSFEPGCGSSGNPCKIYTAQQLNNIRTDLDDHFILMSNINLSRFDNDSNSNNGNWIPVGTDSSPFIGTLDGNNHVILNMDIQEAVGMFSGNPAYVGFFGFIGSGGTVKNTGFEGVVYNGSANSVGGIAGVNKGTIENSYMNGNVDGNLDDNIDVGGLAGSNDGTIKNSYSIGTASGSIFVGGLVGNNDGIIENSYSEVDVSGTTNVGGLVGINDGTIKSSYATGNVNGNQFIGGLVGHNNLTCTNSYWDTTTSRITTSACGAGRTSTQLKQGTAGSTINSEQIFTGWSTVIWDFGISTEYPKLKIDV